MVKGYVFLLFKKFLKRFPGTRRNQFWKPCRSVFCQRPRFLSINVRNWLKKFLFKKFFSSVGSCGHWDCRFDEPAETFRQNPSFFAKATKMNKKFFFPQKIYSCSKSSHGLEKCSSNKPAQLFLPKFDGKLSGSPKVAKRNINFISKWLFFLVMFPWTPRLQFWPACRNCFVKNPKCFRSKSENQKIVVFISGKKLPQNVPMDTWNAILTTKPKFCSQRSAFFLMKLRNICFSSKCSPGHPYCTFDKLARNFPQKHGKDLAENFDIDENIFFPKKKSSKFSFVGVKGSFDNPFQNFSQKLG